MERHRHGNLHAVKKVLRYKPAIGFSNVKGELFEPAILECMRDLLYGVVEIKQGVNFFKWEVPCVLARALPGKARVGNKNPSALRPA
jgi:hypothetical protein